MLPGNITNFLQDVRRKLYDEFSSKGAKSKFFKHYIIKEYDNYISQILQNPEKYPSVEAIQLNLVYMIQANILSTSSNKLKNKLKNFSNHVCAIQCHDGLVIGMHRFVSQ